MRNRITPELRQKAVDLKSSGQSYDQVAVALGLSSSNFLFTPELEIPTDAACHKCGSTGKLNRHHPNYQRINEFVILCNSCHMKEHARLKQLKLKRDRGHMEDPRQNGIGPLIKWFRTKSKMTLMDISKELKVSMSEMYLIESGKPISFPNVGKILNWLIS